MQIAAPPPQHTVTQSTAATQATAARDDVDAFTVERSPEEQARIREQIYADYDLTNITPNEIDELGARLWEAGDTDLESTFMLLTRGAKFQEHLCQMLYEAGIIDSPDFDGDRAFNLIDGVANQLEMSRRMGDPTEYLERALAELKDIHARSEEIRAERDAPIPPSTSASAQSMIAFQAGAGAMTAH